MQRSVSGTWATILAAAVLALASDATAAPRFKILHAFGKGNDGAGLWGSLALDAKGNLYGAAAGGGGTGCNGGGCGILFELAPRPDGRWKEIVLHRFDGRDGAGPSDGLALDATGDLYGMTTAYTTSVFELSPGPRGWTLTPLHAASGYATLALDKEGNLYAPFGGGQYSAGVISELVKADGWAENWIYSFCPNGGKCVDGAIPYAGVAWGPDGSLYGTTTSGGNGGYGVVFRLTPQPDGTWEETVLHSFPGFPTDGWEPYDGVVLDGAGNVYGATSQGGGGGHDCGVIFKLAPQADGKWKETILYDFPNTSQGCAANTPAFDANGNLWGTTVTGGTGQCSGGCGVVFELTPQPSGKWRYSVAHRFNGTDGALPYSAVIFDKQGNLYGTTILGGPGNSVGVAFEIAP